MESVADEMVGRVYALDDGDVDDGYRSRDGCFELMSCLSHGALLVGKWPCLLLKS